jgi:hypothetical protein
VLLTYHFALSKLYTEPVLSTKFLYKGSYIDAAYQVSVHLAKQFQRRRFFLEIYQSETIKITFGGHVC